MPPIPSGCCVCGVEDGGVTGFTVDGSSGIADENVGNGELFLGGETGVVVCVGAIEGFGGSAGGSDTTGGVPAEAVGVLMMRLSVSCCFGSRAGFFGSIPFYRAGFQKDCQDLPLFRGHA